MESGTGFSPARWGMTRRAFLAMVGASPAARLLAKQPPAPSAPSMAALRKAVVDTPLTIGLHRAKVFTDVFRQHEAKPWIVRKALALQEYLKSVPLYVREGDGIAGAISEAPGAMPVMAELGIGENGIYTSERPDRAGHLDGRVPEDIREYWMNRNEIGRASCRERGEHSVVAGTLKKTQW